jgi:hypothetical protein
MTRLSLLIAAAAPLLISLPAAAQPARAPVVVELFQSQGCSSCPPANAYVNSIADRPDVLALSFAVTYWDDLGWKDIFASPAYTDRQWAYAHAIGRGQVFTPEVVVNGRHDVVGSDRGALERALRDGSADQPATAVAVSGGRVTVSAGKSAAPADVWLVRYDPRVVQVAIKRGENGGRTLPHKNIVRQLVRLGSWTGTEASFTLPAPSLPGLNTAVLVQQARGGPIIAAARG